MEYREIGTTGIRISEIGFGCGGNAGLMVRGTPAEQRDTIARAIELGINYFDNSPDYGDGAAETNLGRVLKELHVHPFLNTKVEIRNENLDDIAGHVVRSVDESLKRLGVDYVDVLQIHNAPVDPAPKLEGRVYARIWVEDYLKPNGALEGLERVVRQGKAQAIGFICRGDGIGPVRRLLDEGCFDILNVSFHLMHPTAGYPKPRGLDVLDWEQVIDEAEMSGAGVAIYSPLNSGALTDSAVAGDPSHPLAQVRRAADSPEARRLRDQSASFSFLSRPGEQTLAQANYRFILAKSGVTTVLGGFSEVGQMEELVQASGADPLTEKEMARVEMVWRSNMGVEPSQKQDVRNTAHP
ncbi:MAG TPA: aldo/keto reductase [Chloroflexota bacterium]|nr:aldo/keto reductase [Chloroflexota bacterium]